MSRAVLLSLLVALVPAPVHAQVLLDQFGDFGPEASSVAHQLDVVLSDTAKVHLVQTSVVLTEGNCTVRITDPTGKVVFDVSTSGTMSIGGQMLRTSGQTGTFRVEVVPQQAVGPWMVHVKAVEAWSRIAPYFIPAVGMIIVAMGAWLGWWFWSGAKWRWFWVGAGVWTVGVVLKFAWAIPLNGPILAGIAALLPHDAYLAVGSLYIGLLTGVFEIGVTLLAALIWRKMAHDAARGVAVGVGAGAFEAALLGGSLALTLFAASVSQGSLRDELLAAIGGSASATPLMLLVAPVERIIAILCHTSSRALVLWGVARGRWFWPFAAGFLIMTAIDTVAGYAHLSGQLGKISVWWIELAIAPAAVVSIPIVAWCIRNWPPAEPADDAAGAPLPTA